MSLRHPAHLPRANGESGPAKTQNHRIDLYCVSSHVAEPSLLWRDTGNAQVFKQRHAFGEPRLDLDSEGRQSRRELARR